MRTDAVSESATSPTPARRVVFIVARLLVAALLIAALAVTFAGSWADWTSAGYPDLGTLVTNFWSYFTVESNAIAAVVLLIGVVILARGNPTDPNWYAVLRGCAVVFMTVTGIVYNLLLRGVAVSGAAEDPHPWTNEVLHVVGPIYLVLDWLLAPGRRPLEWKRLAIILSLPLVWVVYTLVRGPLVYDQVRVQASWYPYPFLNPALSPNGYLSVTFYVILIAVVFGAVGALVIWISRRGQRTTSV